MGYIGVLKKKKIPRRPKSVARELIPCRHFEPARVKPN